MSGICAIARPDGKQMDRPLLAAMLQTMEARGPDGQSFWIGGSVALGHALLKSTYEAELERQPATLDGAVWISADARVDARDDLIRKLRGYGRDIEAPISDDRLILHAYAVWGTDCLDHMIGDFGFTLWDMRRKQLFCACDHFGVVPLYFASIQGDFLASNSLNCLHLHSGVSDTLNEQAVGDYLLFRMNQNSGSTTFKDIQKLPAAHKLVWKDGEISVSPYWSYSEHPFERRTQAAYLEEFREIFGHSVSDRLRSDAAGVHVSGGMDSTSVAATLAEQAKPEGSRFDIRGYTMVLSDTALSVEYPFAQSMANKAQIPLTPYNAKSDGFLDTKAFGDLSMAPPEPSFARGDTARRFIAEDVSTFSRVLFTGFGGDPLFHASADYWERQRANGNWGHLLIDVARHLSIHRRMPSGLAPFPRNARQPQNGAASWLNRDFVDRNDLTSRLAKYTEPIRAATDQRRTMVGDALWRRLFEWNDPGFSGSAVKVRHPFFDMRLLNWAQRVPPWPWFYRKHLLREAMHDRLPHKILQRPKTAIPGNKWRKLMDRPEFTAQLEEFLSDPELLQYVDRDAMLGSVLDGSPLAVKSIMRINSFAKWLGCRKPALRNIKARQVKGLGNYVRREHGNR